MPSSNLKRSVIIALGLSMGLVGCQSNNGMTKDTAPSSNYKLFNFGLSSDTPEMLKQYLVLRGDGTANAGNESKDDGIMLNLRLKVIKDAAYSLGLQAGLAWRTDIINKLLESNDGYNSRIFNFSPFLYDGKILSPVVLESERMFHQESDKRARTVSISYSLTRDARIVASPPTWRDYLARPVIDPVLPNDRLFPVSNQEIKAWEIQMVRGWNDGIEQADEINQLDQRRLERDYTGMQRFRMLVSQGVIAMPKLSVGTFGIMKDGKTLNVNDVVYEITTDADFNENSKWSPVFRD